MSENLTPRLTMKGICKRFGATIALRDVDLEIYPARVHALIGENGAGKSTLMKTLSGAYIPDSGAMTLEGKPYNPANPLTARRQGVAMIYQELSLAPHLSVRENIVLGMEPVKMGFLRRRTVNELAETALERLGHDDIDPARLVSRLSVAEQQIVEIARAMAVGCKVLVFDEPTSSLTEKDVRMLFELIRKLREQGMAIVYISHFLEEVREIADTFTVLRDGRTVGGGAISETDNSRIIEMMVGRQVDRLYPRSERKPGQIVLEVENLTGGEKPIGASFSLRRGEVLGISGLVGAGRTELVRALFGLDQVKAGNVKVAALSGPQRALEKTGPAARWRQGIGMLSENRKDEGLALSLSIADNVTLSDLTGFGWKFFVLPSKQQKKAGTWLDKLAIKCSGPGQDVVDLSGGNQQKVALARLLAHDVDVLILDEPTRGIDVGSKALIYQLIDNLVCPDPAGTTKPRAVLVVSSYLPELMGICDRIAVMCKGKLGPAHDIKEINEHQLMLEATGTAANQK